MSLDKLHTIFIELPSRIETAIRKDDEILIGHYIAELREAKELVDAMYEKQQKDIKFARTYVSA